MVAGCPRTVSPSPEECIKLGKELVEWATEETEEWRCLLQQWYSIKKGILRKDWKTIVQVKEFLPYYEQAQAALAKKAVDGTMNEKFGQRYIRLYDRELIEEENAQAKIDAEIKKSLETTTPQKVVFEVNYSNESTKAIDDKVTISPPQLSAPNTESAQ